MTGPPRRNRPSRSDRGRAPTGEETAGILNDIARIATEDLELKPMLQRITDTLAERFGWEFVALVRVDAHRARFVCEAVTTRLRSGVHVGYGRELGSGVVGRVAVTGASIEIDDADGFPGFVDTLPGARSELCVPVKHRGGVVAILNLESRQRAAFRGRLPLLETIAEQIAGAIASARLLLEARRRARDLETLSEVGRIALGGRDLQLVLDRIVRYVRRRFDLSLAAVLLASQDRHRFDFQAVASSQPVAVPTPSTWSTDIGIVGRAIRSGEPQLVADVAADPDYFAVAEGTVAEFVVPIRFRGRVMGAFNFESIDAAALTPDACGVLEMLADQVAGALHLTRMNRRLSRTKQQLQLANRHLREANRVLDRLTVVDGLTHVANRRGFDHVLDLEWRRAVRAAMPLSLLLVDVDGFKAINDARGHQYGDACLRDIAAALADAVRRASDMVARYGGEEFAVILPATPSEAALAMAELLRARVEALRLPHGGSSVSAFVTVSAGVATTVPTVKDSPASLVSDADGALYLAKANGRNRVVTAPSKH
jgi:diguanylate cyclase (GGDEF)-like protein